jgi:glycosyltransferase involved in cell wall biosynthesis
MLATAATLVALPVVLGLYSYIVYPAVLSILPTRFQRRHKQRDRALGPLPTVSVVVPAYNEHTQIRGAIEGLLAQSYPHDRMQIVILSDASTDGTDEIVKEYADRGVELMRMPERSGKTALENAACALLRGDIVVNSDASIRLHPDAVRHLVDHLADPSVGVASGRDVSVAVADAAANRTEADYVEYEMRIRALESRTGGIVGASGCCYAIRSELHRLPIPPDLSRDFSAPLTARAHGFSAVSVDDAIAFVPRTPSLRREYARKVRTISRGMETLYPVRVMMDPIRYGAFAWKLISHKVCRWLMPLTGVPALIGLAILARTQTWAAAVLAAIIVVLAIALVGWMWPESKRMPRPISIVAFGVAANVAVIHAVFRLMTERGDKIWEPTRREVIAPTA